jgi:hypothetical protein
MARNCEAEASSIIADVWLLREYNCQLAPSSVKLTPRRVNNHVSRLGWIVDHLAKDAEALADAVWGDGEGACCMAESYESCEAVEQQDAA